MPPRRTTRGAKNELTGKRWTEAELQAVMRIYPNVKDALHEQNITIGELGKTLGRTTRSVEAQLIMFRKLDRGEYGWGNMSKLSLKVFTEFSRLNPKMTPNSKQEQGSEPETQPPQSFPLGLLAWSGHRTGGVRKPFRDESGRPAGKINTPLTDRLEQWAKQVPADINRDLPYRLLLIGGPGNGKTDSIERCISCLDKALNANGKLTEKFADEFDADAIPRNIEVDLESLGIDLPEHLNCKIKLVQDASEAPGIVSAEELFLNDLRDIENDIYLCCINRGILANASNLARNSSREREYEILKVITNAVTSSSNSISCWPLENNPSFAVWPMDIESLVDTNVAQDGVTIGHKIFSVALDDSKWQEECELGDMCPFCLNKKLLSDKNNLDHLISTLRYFELTGGKRWTFRDLFSLVPYLLVGDASELKVKDKQFSPCGWAKHQLALARKSGKSVAEASATYRLAGRIYYHRLFPVWPSLSRGKYREAKRFVFKDNQLKPDVVVAKNLFRYLENSSKFLLLAGGEVPETIRNEFSGHLDPSKMDASQALFMRNKSAVTVGEIEDWFSLSVEDGYKKIDRKVSKLEKAVFKRLIQSDNALTEDNFSRNHWSQIGLLQQAVRQFAARFAKRSLCVRSGVVADFDFLKKFEKLNYSDDAMDDARRQLRILLHENDSSFRAGLATTFGQPLATKDRDVALVVQERIKVRKVNVIRDKSRPRSQLRFLQVNRFDIPLTFQLYKALLLLGEGMNEASLGSDIFSLLGRVKALVAGSLVRDKSVLEDEPFIQIGLNQKIDVEPNKFSFQRIR